MVIRGSLCPASAVFSPIGECRLNVSVVEKQMCGEYLHAFADLVFILDENGLILGYKSGNPSMPVTCPPETY